MHHNLSNGYEGVHGKFGIETRNAESERILEILRCSGDGCMWSIFYVG